MAMLRAHTAPQKACTQLALCALCCLPCFLRNRMESHALVSPPGPQKHAPPSTGILQQSKVTVHYGTGTYVTGMWLVLTFLLMNDMRSYGHPASTI
jgi:hypothetical protein